MEHPVDGMRRGVGAREDLGRLLGRIRWTPTLSPKNGRKSDVAGQGRPNQREPLMIHAGSARLDAVAGPASMAAPAGRRRDKAKHAGDRHDEGDEPSDIRVIANRMRRGPRCLLWHAGQTACIESVAIRWSEPLGGTGRGEGVRKK